LEGRIYRQGNAFKNVRIVNPLMIDSADIFMFQKLEEKTSRINSIFDTDGQTNILKTEEFNPKELKYSLIKNPRVIADMELMEDIETVSEDITDKKADVEKLERFIEQLENIEYRKDDLKELLKDVRSKSVDKPLKEQINAIQDFWRTKLDEQKRYVKQGSYDSVPKDMVQSPLSNVYKPYWFDDFNMNVRNVERFKRDYLTPKRVPDKDVADYIGRVKFEIEELEKLKTSLTSDEAKDRKVMEVLEKREKLQIKEKSVDELVKDFARMNYLLDDVTLPKVIEPKVLMCPPVDANGVVRIDSEGLMLLDECIKSQPQTKYLNSKEIKTEDGTVVYEYTEKRKELHKEIIDKLVGSALCTDQIEPIAIIMGGAPGSGKSTFLKNNAPYLQTDKIWKVDADEVRSMLPEYKGWNAPVTHEEAKDVVNMLLDRYDTPCKHDLLYDGTMSNVKKYRPLIKRLKKLGYKVFLVFMEIPKEDSIKRALKRYQDNNAKTGEFGRYVPISVIEDFYGTGDEAFQLLKKEVDGYIKVDGIKQLIEERGGMQLPENRSYAGLGTNILPKVEKVIETAKPTTKVDFTEKRLKALKISLRFSKDKAMVEKRIKALEISLKVLAMKKSENPPVDKTKDVEYDWDFTFTSGPSKGQKLSEKVIDYIDVYDDFIYNLEFKGTPSSFQANTKETIGLLSITDNPVKLAVILDNDVFSSQKIIRRLQKLAANSGRIIVDNNDESRSERRSFPYLLVAPKDADKYTISEKFQGKLDTPTRAYVKNAINHIATFFDEKNSISYKVRKSDKTPGRFEVVSSSPRWKEDIVEVFVSEEDAINHAKLSAGIIKEEDPEKGFMNKTEARKPSLVESNLLKELHKLQKDLYSSRLSTFKEDGSDEANALKRERESKLTRFNEVLATLNELDSKKYGEGGNVGDKGKVHIVNENHVFDENQYGAVFDDYDGDGVVNIDDAFPNDKTKQGFVDKVRLQPIFKKLIDLKNNLNTVMYNAVDELKEKSPKTADIYARTKTPYSILKKLVDKRLMDETKGLTDLVGTTIAVDNYNDLIKVKNQIDAGLLGKVVDFDDFYAKPKAGYMAYHYIVKTDEGYSVEVQLKTKRMKNLNKVSHEFYKLGSLDSKNFLEVTQLTHNADLGNKESISQYNKLMNSPDLLREIMTGKIDLKKALEQKSNLLAKGGSVSDQEIFEQQFGKM
jgi:ppGpp synthetase/RelA/SpoT-type nucleotidyltranferase/predicted ABC-type ATPase